VLRQAYTANGLSMDGGGTFTLPRLVGCARALEIVAFDPPIAARQALEWGLATRVAPDGAAVDEAVALAARVAAVSLHSYGLSKRLLGGAFDTPLEAQLEREREALAACGAHADGQEGLRAFVEKRKPSFSR
jgi:2-(1,2-epoxy-1,2-dihydrophenyl)acetyl-CoA isomerase